MKSIIMCYTPEECERIANGEQTVKVCKTAPKEVPFKVYIYQTKSKDNFIYRNYKVDDIRSGKIIGEFICNRVDKYLYDCCDGLDIDDDTLVETYLDWEEINIYAKGKPLYGLHISELKIYDEPRELSDFKIRKFIRGYHKKTEKNETFKDKLESLKHSKRVEVKIITRPPQSWYYVEESVK